MKLALGHTVAAAAMMVAQAACAQPTTPPTTPPTQPPAAPGLGPTPNPERPGMTPPERGVIRPPANVDPEMRVLTPDPLPGRTPVVPPPANTPDRPRVEPR
ncbi:hypothetical protein IBL26_08230 [Roseomonas aerophila]|uniref:Uncharacterized protein n=1 Tax=Teichococcus aerophilus TaxID=1224513 RepID=A0ABR7RKG6_9PROT|nr:hypothetical protein [Pseudoroseomonas aerophila]MBC9206821.1 hypothetical protein [Pseudoroseomonas aerophila]